MLRKKYSISFIAVSVLILLIFAVIPHHHHSDGIVFAVIDNCGDENTFHGEHTGRDKAEHGGNNLLCIESSDFITPQSESSVKCRITLCNTSYNHIHLFPVLISVADLLIYNPEDLFSDPEYGEYLILYDSADAGRSNGLRAPPYCFS